MSKFLDKLVTRAGAFLTLTAILLSMTVPLCFGLLYFMEYKPLGESCPFPSAQGVLSEIQTLLDRAKIPAQEPHK